MSIRAARYEKEKDITIIGTIDGIDSFDGYEVILEDVIIVDKQTISRHHIVFTLCIVRP